MDNGLKIQRCSFLPEGEMAIIKDSNTLIHNIVDSELKEKDKEIERLNKELLIKTDFIEELLQIIAVARDYELHEKCHIRAKIYEDKLKQLKGDNNEK